MLEFTSLPGGYRTRLLGWFSLISLMMLVGATWPVAVSASAAVTSQASAQSVRATRLAPNGRSTHRPASRPAAESARSQARARAGREHLVEGNLRDINQRLESQPGGQSDPVLPARCPTCGERARLREQPDVAKGNPELRGNLHRLQREVRERKTPHTREHVVEEKLSRPD